MIIETPFGSVSEERYSDFEVDYLDIEWYNVHKAVAVLTTGGGREISLRPDEDTRRLGWSNGDVVFVGDGELVVVRIPPVRCISITPGSKAELISLCYEIGNRHAPLFYGEDFGELLTPADDPLFALLERLDFNPVHKTVTLAPERCISRSTGQGGHSHGGHHHD